MILITKLRCSVFILPHGIAVTGLPRRFQTSTINCTPNFHNQQNQLYTLCIRFHTKQPNFRTLRKRFQTPVSYPSYMFHTKQQTFHTPGTMFHTKYPRFHISHHTFRSNLLNRLIPVARCTIAWNSGAGHVISRKKHAMTKMAGR
jgi:hypothetical protein